MDKKGVSAIVTTVIMLALILVAVGIVWFVISGLIQNNAAEVGLNSKCLKISISPTKATCDSNLCNLTLTRKVGGDDEIGGVKIVFSNEAEGSKVVSYDQTIAPLETAILSYTLEEIGLTNAPTKIETAAYINDDAGKEYICSQTNSFEI
jgi:flagellin-like protein